LAGMIRIRKLFEEKSDLFHFVIGLSISVIKYLKSISLYFRIASIAVYLIFILYQHLEEEEKIETVKDIVEFLSGYVFGTVIFG
jgi:4-hydroxybenzoate polyprenyltransferase